MVLMVLGGRLQVEGLFAIFLNNLQKGMKSDDTA